MNLKAQSKIANTAASSHVKGKKSTPVNMGSARYANVGLKRNNDYQDDEEEFGPESKKQNQ